MLFGKKVTSTEEIGFRILEALSKDAARVPRDLYARLPMEEQARVLMKRHGWSAFDFGRGWSLVLDDRLIDGCQDGGHFYAWPTTAGREFLAQARRDRRRLRFTPRWAYFWLGLFCVAVWGMFEDHLFTYYLAVICAGMLAPIRRPGS